MKFASVRLITDDVDRLVAFYELVTGMTCNRPSPVFAELVTPAGTLAIGGAATLPLFEGSDLKAAANDSAIIEFQVDDVDQRRQLHGGRDAQRGLVHAAQHHGQIEGASRVDHAMRLTDAARLGELDVDAVGEAGGLGVLNAEGLWARYEDPLPAYRKVRDAAAAGAPSASRSRRRRRPTSSTSSSRSWTPSAAASSWWKGCSASTT